MEDFLPKVEEISWSRLSEDRKKNDPKSTKTQTSIVISLHIYFLKVLRPPPRVDINEGHGQFLETKEETFEKNV